MADLKISQLTGATTPLAGTEVLPIVQSSTTKKVATDDLTVKNVRSNATSGILQVAGPGAGTTRTMTTPNANFTAARTDAAQTFTGLQTFSGGLVTATGQTSVPDSTATTIFALPSTTQVACLQIFANLLDGSGSNSYIVIVYDRTNARIAVTGNDTSLTLSLSGRNVQVTQTFGSTQTIDWGYVLAKYA